MEVCRKVSPFSNVLWNVQGGIRYPVTVRFESTNYQGVATSNYGLDEIQEV
jgi:hypothetical protein